VDPAAADGADQTGAATRIALRPHDPRTGEEIEKSQVVKGYEYDRGQFVTFSADELRALDVESSKVIDLERFLSLGDIDPVYFDTPYYLYPDGPVALEALRVIGRSHSLLSHKKFPVRTPREFSCTALKLQHSLEHRARF
jgi:non-homologous end joining protein Ku